jgi:hypothetical protein
MATDEIEYNAFFHTLQVLWLSYVSEIKTQAPYDIKNFE